MTVTNFFLNKLPGAGYVSFFTNQGQIMHGPNARQTCPKAICALPLKICHFAFLSFALIVCFGRLSAYPAETVADAKIEIPNSRFVLSNGLTVIVHEDHKAPIVAVNLCYHVGSKNEVPGKTGFAHLFEHLLFTGSEHLKGTGDQRAFFETMERVGATDLNGTTSNDRTDYFENIPKNALDTALWLESDRMGHFLGVMDQAKLDVQRGVVQNEKRQGENQPYGVAWELIAKGTAQAGHPYSWTVIGSMEDLNAASLEDVRTWFKTYYGPANCTLVIAGDVDADTVRRKAEQYFGDIPSGPPVARFESWIPQIPGTRRQQVEDRVPQARLYKVWNMPAYGEAEATQLVLASDVLVSWKTGRLYKRLVYDDQLATDVTAYVSSQEISGQFIVIATARPGVDLPKLEKALDEEIAHFVAKGPTQKELERVKAGRITRFIQGIERIGGFGGKSDILAMNETLRGNPDFYKTIFQQQREATVHDLHAAAKKWLNDNVYILEVHPFPEFQTLSQSVDRSKVPVPSSPPDVKFPDLHRGKLSNGLQVVLAERHSIPLVKINLLLDAGFAADQFAIPGTVRLSSELLDQGTTKRTATQINEELASLGAGLAAASDLDSSLVGLSTLNSTLDRTLDIYADVILNPVFPEADFKRLQKTLIAAIQQERTEPFGMALRVFPGLLYGKEHAYGNPFSGSGTEASIKKLTRADVQKFHDTWFKPNNASLIVVGDTTLKEMMPRLEKAFASWKPGTVPGKNLSRISLPEKTKVYLIDRPGSLQSMLFAGNIAPPKANPADIAIETMNNVLGGTFSSRVNMNLREGKHWTYGAKSLVIDTKGQRPFIAYAPVQTDKTKESMIELDKELRGIVGKQPVMHDELVKCQQQQTLCLPGRWETSVAVLSSIGDIVRYGLPDDYFSTYPTKVHDLTVADLVKAADAVVHPDQLIWVVVGDRAKVEAGVRELGWGELRFLDADGLSIHSVGVQAAK
jgi:zinc protease